MCIHKIQTQYIRLVKRQRPDPEDLPGDVSDPVLLQCVAFGVLHQVCDGAGATELHHQLEETRRETQRRRCTHTHAISDEQQEAQHAAFNHQRNCIITFNTKDHHY